MDYSDEIEGLTLEQALERFSSPDQYKLERHLFAMLDDAGFFPPAFHMQQKMKWRRIRKPLEAAFREQLVSGTFVLCGYHFGEWGAIDPIWLPDAHIDYQNQRVVVMPMFYDGVRAYGVKPMEEVQPATLVGTGFVEPVGPKQSYAPAMALATAGPSIHQTWASSGVSRR